MLHKHSYLIGTKLQVGSGLGKDEVTQMQHCKTGIIFVRNTKIKFSYAATYVFISTYCAVGLGARNK